MLFLFIMYNKSIVLLSGGMDSLLTLAIAIEQKEIPFALHINYLQNTQKKELAAYNDICDYYKLPEEQRLVIDIDYLAKIGGTSLINNEIIQEKNHTDIPNSYVPFRNANILAIATAWAEVINAKSLFIGASQVDYSGYPDCRQVFFDAFEKAINLGTKPETEIKIVTPLMEMTKADIVSKGIELKVPFELSWSCYFDNDKACGICDSCKLRLSGFNKLGIKDPIPYNSL